MYIQNQVAGLGDVVNSSALNRGFREEFMSFYDMKALPAEIMAGIADQSLLITDGVVYNTRPIVGETVDLFKSDDKIVRGLRNVSERKLQKGRCMVVSAIQFLAAYTVKDEGDNVKAGEDSKGQTANWKNLDYYEEQAVLIGRATAGGVANTVITVADGETTPLTTASGFGILDRGYPLFQHLESGEFTLKINKREILTDYPLSALKGACHNGLKGLYKLANPRLLVDQTDIEATVYLGQGLDADGNTEAVWGRFALLGCMTAPR